MWLKYYACFSSWLWARRFWDCGWWRVLGTKTTGAGERRSLASTWSFQTIAGGLPFCSLLSYFSHLESGWDTFVFLMGRELGKASSDLGKALGRNVPFCPVPQCSTHPQGYASLSLKQEESTSGTMPLGADFQVWTGVNTLKWMCEARAFHKEIQGEIF